MAKAAQKITFQIVGIWLSLRLLTSLAAAAFSSLKPFTEIEKQIPVWPPAQNLLAWLERVLIAPWQRYDAVWFERILVRGYIAGDGSTSFHPLYALTSWPLYRLGLNATLSLLITSSLAALAFFWVFYKLATLDLAPSESWIALIFLAIFPVSFILFAPYTESLFLFLTAASLYTMRRYRWGLSAVLCFLATLTRQQGLFLSIPMAWWAWEASGKTLVGCKKALHGWLATLAAPAALLSFTVYRIGILHEGRVDFTSLQSLIYSAIFSSSNYQVVAGQAFRWPWQALATALSKIIYHPENNVITNLILGIAFLAAFILAWKHLNIADRLYSLTVVIISFSFTTGEYGYMSLPRHLFIALPVFIGLAAALRKPWQIQLLLTCEALGLIFLIYGYVLNGWIP